MVLPGLVDTHVHINEPGRTDWEGFASATRAAASGGVTTLVDMPLNSIPSTTTCQALAEKRSAARGQCLVDYGFWGGIVGAGRLRIRQSGRHRCRSPTPVCSASSASWFPPAWTNSPTSRNGNWKRRCRSSRARDVPCWYTRKCPDPSKRPALKLPATRAGYRTYLASRPDESELEAVRLMIRLSRWFRCRVHIVHLATAQALPDLGAAACRSCAGDRRNLSSLSASGGGGDPGRRVAVQVRAAHPRICESRPPLGRAAKRSHRSHCHRSFAQPARK